MGKTDFCDRDVQITLCRAWMRYGLLNKCKLLASLLIRGL
jgi:pheromone shutdown protein TraB